MKKGPENPISVVVDKAAANGANPYDRSFGRGVLASADAPSSDCLSARSATVPPSQCPVHGRPSPGSSPCRADRARPGGERCGLMPAVPGGRPARPAGQRLAGVCRRPPSGIPRLVLPDFPSGRTRPRVPACTALSLFPFPRSPRPPSAVADWAGAGLDGAGGAERPSSRTHGRAALGNGNRSRSACRHPGRSTRYRG